MSLEQQLSDAIAAQNALTQVVAGKQAAIDAATAAQQASFEGWKNGAITTVAVDVLKLFQSAGIVERSDGGASTKAWDSAGALKFTDAVGGHGLQSKLVLLPAGRYVISVHGYFLTTNITYSIPGRDDAAPIGVGLYVLNRSGNVNFGDAMVGGAEGKSFESMSKFTAGFTLAAPAEVMPIIYSNGNVGAKQLVLTAAYIGRYPS